jgi:hypothetical protein
MKAAPIALSIGLLIGSPLAALAEGKLDLSLATPIQLPAPQSKDVAPLPVELWAPGSPLFARRESRGVQALSYAGYGAMAGMGIAQNAQGFGRNREATAVTAGFGAIAAVQLWNAWKWLTAPDSRK